MLRTIGSRRRWGTWALTGGMAPVALLWLAPCT